MISLVAALVIHAAPAAQPAPVSFGDQLLLADTAVMSLHVADHTLRGELPLGGLLSLPASLLAAKLELGPLGMLLLDVLKLAAHLVPHWIPGVSSEPLDVVYDAWASGENVLGVRSPVLGRASNTVDVLALAGHLGHLALTVHDGFRHGFTWTRPYQDRAQAAGAPAPVQSPWHLELSTAPQFFLLGGWSASVAVSTPALPRWRFAATPFSLLLPSAFLGAENAGWTRRDNGVGIGPDYFFGDRGGFFIGADLAPHVNTYARAEGDVTMFQLFALPRGGYQWFPFADRGLFLEAWLGAAIPLYQAGEIRVADAVYKPKPFTPLAAGFIGWQL